MTLHVDDQAAWTFFQIINDLRSARVASGQSQDALSCRLPVRGRAISEWETGAIQPALRHLIQWSRALDHPLVIAGRGGEPREGPHRLSREAWETFELRRLVVPLRNRRLALGMLQGEIASLVGVSRDSIHRWELARVPPRPMALIVWAHKLDYRLRLQSAGERHGSQLGHSPRRP